MSIYVGIDVGKFFNVAYCLDERGNRLGYLKFDNHCTGFTEPVYPFLTRIHSFSIFFP